MPSRCFAGSTDIELEHDSVFYLSLQRSVMPVTPIPGHRPWQHSMQVATSSRSHPPAQHSPACANAISYNDSQFDVYERSSNFSVSPA
jgi:hypothetical protein